MAKDQIPMAKPYFAPRPDMVEGAVTEAVTHIQKCGFRVLIDRDASQFGSVYLKILKPWIPKHGMKPVWVSTPHTIRISDHPPNRFSARMSVHPGSDRGFEEIWNEVSREIANRLNRARSERARKKDHIDKTHKRIAHFKKQRGRR
jgi:hypothetical protein